MVGKGLMGRRLSGRFGSVRCGPIRRGSLVGVVVALVLVAVPLLVVGAASGRAGGRAYSSPGGRVSHVAFLAPVAGFIVNELASNLFSTGFGWVLGQFGEGDGLDSQIGQIQEKLQTIENRLSAIEASTDQLRKELVQVNFNHLAADANTIIGQINYGMDRLNTIADWPAHLDQAEKKKEAESLVSYIGHNLLDKQHVLDLKIAPTVGEGLIASAYKVEKSHIGLFWTRRNWFQVRDVLDYYQDQEARLLLLRVEYWHATGRSGDFIKYEISRFEQTLREQRLLLKARPLLDVIIDTRNKKQWMLTDLFKPTTSGGALNTEKIWASSGQGWRLPTEAEVVQLLIKGWSGKNWAEWINNDIGGQLTVPCCFEGAWTGQYTSGGSLGTGYIAVRGNGTIWVPGADKLLGVLLMRQPPTERVGGKYVEVSYW